MSDRVPVTIRIGGVLPRTRLAEFVAAIEAEALTDPLGEYFALNQIAGLEPLELSANEVAWGRLDTLEAFCLEHGLPFERWCGSYPGSWEAERVCFDGSAEPRSYTVTENDVVVVTELEVRSLGSYEAIIAYLESAALTLPALRIDDGQGSQPR